MGHADRLVQGAYNAICDRCGFKFKNYECKLEWNNLFVCKDCWEPRQPQDLLKGRADDTSVPIARPVPPIKWVE